MFERAMISEDTLYREEQFGLGFQRGLDERDGTRSEPGPDDEQTDFYWEGREAGLSKRP